MSIITSEAIIEQPSIGYKTKVLGMRSIVSDAYNNIDLTPLWDILLNRYNANAFDAAALYDMHIILLTQNRKEDAMNVLNIALDIQRDFCVVHGDGSGVKILALVTKGDFMDNTPIDFLLGGTNAVIWYHYIDENTQHLNNLPEYDVAFMAIGESNENGPILKNANELIKKLNKPIMNNNPLLINEFTRDGVYNLLKNEPSIAIPKTVRVTRDKISALANDEIKLSKIDLSFNYPIIIRPIGTHAGNGMAKITDKTQLKEWLTQHDVNEAYIFPFIDYRNEEGKFNKQRVVLINGKPFASHMAISDNWMVHYMNADMLENEKNRQTEAKWFESFDNNYAIKYKQSFEALHRVTGLDYFGFDCAMLPDGRLLIFEIDVAMIVHDMDSQNLFPYKKPAMQKLFNAFIASVENKKKQKKIYDK